MDDTVFIRSLDGSVYDVPSVRFDTPNTEIEISNDLVIMQFTGLLDRNGVEIYEGDFVSDHVGVGLICYSEKHAAFRVIYGDGLAKWFYDYNLKGERESIAVIGNIHQNKELLNHG
jgi:uncharacterized phage protein (TIGR01671 family)